MLLAGIHLCLNSFPRHQPRMPAFARSAPYEYLRALRAEGLLSFGSGSATPILVAKSTRKYLPRRRLASAVNPAFSTFGCGSARRRITTGGLSTRSTLIDCVSTEGPLAPSRASDWSLEVDSCSRHSRPSTAQDRLQPESRRF
jgi:hypothetical protein